MSNNSKKDAESSKKKTEDSHKTAEQSIKLMESIYKNPEARIRRKSVEFDKKLNSAKKKKSVEFKAKPEFEDTEGLVKDDKIGKKADNQEINSDSTNKNIKNKTDEIIIKQVKHKKKSQDHYGKLEEPYRRKLDALEIEELYRSEKNSNEVTSKAEKNEKVKLEESPEKICKFRKSRSDESLYKSEENLGKCFKTKSSESIKRSPRSKSGGSKVKLEQKYSRSSRAVKSKSDTSFNLSADSANKLDISTKRKSKNAMLSGLDDDKISEKIMFENGSMNNLVKWPMSETSGSTLDIDSKDFKSSGLASKVKPALDTQEKKFDKRQRSKTRPIGIVEDWLSKSTKISAKKSDTADNINLGTLDEFSKLTKVSEKKSETPDNISLDTLDGWEKETQNKKKQVEQVVAIANNKLDEINNEAPKTVKYIKEQSIIITKSKLNDLKIDDLISKPEKSDIEKNDAVEKPEESKIKREQSEKPRRKKKIDDIELETNLPLPNKTENLELVVIEVKNKQADESTPIEEIKTESDDIPKKKRKRKKDNNENDKLDMKSSSEDSAKTLPKKKKRRKKQQLEDHIESIDKEELAKKLDDALKNAKQALKQAIKTKEGETNQEEKINIIDKPKEFIKETDVPDKSTSTKSTSQNEEGTVVIKKKDPMLKVDSQTKADPVMDHRPVSIAQKVDAPPYYSTIESWVYSFMKKALLLGCAYLIGYMKWSPAWLIGEL